MPQNYDDGVVRIYYIIKTTSMVALENAGASFLVLKVNGHRFINI
jgi:hypothetical protein